MLMRQPMEKLIRILRRSREPRGGDQMWASLSYTDEVQAFFVAAYHVKDYVQKEDPRWLAPGYTLQRVKDESEAMFHGPRTSWAMAFTHDLCNGIKHADLRNPKRGITQISGFHSSVGTLNTGMHEVITSYITTSGPKFADDVMVEVLTNWLNFLDRCYLPGASQPLREMYAQLGPKSEGMRELEEGKLASMEAGIGPAPRTLDEEMPRDPTKRAAYWRSLPELPIPEIRTLNETGTLVQVEAIEFVPVSITEAQQVGIKSGTEPVNLPTVRISTKGALARFRLPFPYSEIVEGAFGLILMLGNNPFPCMTEFGRVPGGPRFQGYYMELH